MEPGLPDYLLSIEVLAKPVDQWSMRFNFSKMSLDFFLNEIREPGVLLSRFWLKQTTRDRWDSILAGWVWFFFWWNREQGVLLLRFWLNQWSMRLDIACREMIAYFLWMESGNRACSLLRFWLNQRSIRLDIACRKMIFYFLWMKSGNRAFSLLGCWTNQPTSDRWERILARGFFIFFWLNQGTGRSPVEVLAEPVIDISRVDVTRSKMISYFFLMKSGNQAFSLLKFWLNQWSMRLDITCREMIFYFLWMKSGNRAFSCWGSGRTGDRWDSILPVEKWYLFSLNGIREPGVLLLRF